MNIALIAHDQKKGELIDFVKDNEEIFARWIWLFFFGIL